MLTTRQQAYSSRSCVRFRSILSWSRVRASYGVLIFHFLIEYKLPRLYEVCYEFRTFCHSWQKLAASIIVARAWNNQERHGTLYQMYLRPEVSSHHLNDQMLQTNLGLLKFKISLYNLFDQRYISHVMHNHSHSLTLVKQEIFPKFSTKRFVFCQWCI